MNNTKTDKARKEFILGLYDVLGVYLTFIPPGLKYNPYGWDEYYKTRVEKHVLLNYWLSKYKSFALINGVRSGYITTDFDTMKDGEFKDKLHPKSKGLFDYLSTEYPAWIQKSGDESGQRRHLIYKVDPNRPILTQRLEDYPGVEIKGEKSLTMLAFSIHPSGNIYELLRNPLEENVDLFPYDYFGDKIQIDLSNFNGKDNNSASSQSGPKDPFFKIKEPGRGNWLIEQVGHYCRKTSRWKKVIIALNFAHCDPPLEMDELEKTVFKSGEKYSTDLKGEKELVFKPLKVSELMQKEFDEEEFIIENLVPEHGIIIISGDPGSFKTWNILDMSIKVASGSLFLSKFKVKQCGVLIIDEENNPRLIQKRGKLLGLNKDLNIHILSLASFTLTEESVEMVIDYCKAHNLKLVFFDSLIRIHDEDENSAKDMKKVFRLLRTLTVNGLTVICTHHNRKQGIGANLPSQALRGSSDIRAAVDCHIAIERKQGEGVINFRITKLRNMEEIAPFKANIISEGSKLTLEYAGDINEVETKRPNCKELIIQLLEDEGKSMYKKEVFDKLKDVKKVTVGYGTFSKAVKELIAEKQLFEEKGERNTVYLALEPTS